MYTPKLIDTYPIISDQVSRDELSILLSELELVLATAGDGSIVEFGCYIGTTSLFIRRLMDKYAATGEYHVYDSFAGLPLKTHNDASPAGEQFREGELTASKKDLIKQFKKSNLRLPRIHKAWFSDLTDQDVPDNITFAFLDGDYYESIRDSLYLITPKLTHDAVIVVDDYANEALPGTARATDEWLRIHPAKLHVKSSLAIIHL
ncbi:class I SAM-dependent methyltransferase [Candidatus Saccharibacteria bacterium]|nr:class I SAM-dependent methyltransferase [Candidatus Saccharibacteria bacterium]